MTCDSHWTTYLSALLTPTVAVLGALIAYRQWRLAQNKLKLDLFDRRFSVYEATRNLLASIMTSGKARDEEVFKFMVATREAKWLLNARVAEYLEEQIYRRATELQCLSSELESVSAGEERTSKIRKQYEIKQWFLAQYSVLDAYFAPFLELGH